jgi:hypothetical protein
LFEYESKLDGRLLLAALKPGLVAEIPQAIATLRPQVCDPSGEREQRDLYGRLRREGLKLRLLVL